jgi:hypothetical protein
MFAVRDIRRAFSNSIRLKKPYRNARLGQKDTLHMRTSTNRDITSDLPEDLFCPCTTLENHFGVHGLQNVPRRL